MKQVPNSSTVSSLEGDRVEVLGPANGNAYGARLWVLFIPFGWARDGWCTKTAYKGALRAYPNADGLIDQSIYYHRTKVPLLLVTPVFKKYEITGTAYHIRTDAELNEYLKTKVQKENSVEKE